MSEEGKKIERLYKEDLVDINIDNLKKEEVDELLKNFIESEIETDNETDNKTKTTYNKNIKRLFNEERNINHLKTYRDQYILHLSEDSIKTLFSILNEDNIKNFDFFYNLGNKNLVKLLENIEYNNEFTAIKKLLNSKEINKINTEIVRNLKTKNGLNNLLLYIDENRLSKISLGEIDTSIIIELLEDEKFFEKLKSMFFNPNNIKYCFLLKQLNNEKVNEFLSKLNLNEKIEKISYKDFEINEISDIIEKTKNIDFAKKCFMEIDDKKISEYKFSESSIDILAELIRTLDENDPVFKKIILINYCDRDNNKYFAKLLDKIGKENVIKLLNNVPYNNTFISLSNYSKLCNILNDKKIVEKRIMKEQIFRIQMTKRARLIELPDEENEDRYNLLEEAITELKDEEIAKINLSTVYKNVDGDLKRFIERMIDKRPYNKIPQFDISIISKSVLFNAIRNGKIKNTNIAERSKTNLLFLRDVEKFNIVQKIITEDNLFVKNSETEIIGYNKEALSKLYSKLNVREMLLFFEFYYDSSEKIRQLSEKEELKEKLKEELKNTNRGVSAIDALIKDFFNPNDDLKTEKHPDGYMKNRQRNKNFLLDIFLEKNQRRIERIGRLKEIENREEIFKINYNSKNINKPANEKEEVEYIVKQYHYETLRRAIVDYSRRVEPFVKEHFNPEEAEEITRNIEDALGILFYPDSSNTFKLKAQKILRDNIDKIEKKYKDFMKKEKGINVIGSHLMFSSICNAESIIELNEALYSHIRTKIVDDYSTKHSFEKDDENKKTLLETDSDKLYRAYGNLNEEELKEALYNFTCSPIAQTGRKKYKTFDMITKEENKKNGNSVNITCSVAGKSSSTHDSNAGSYTSFSNKSENIKKYATSILSVYTPTENSKKSLFTDVANRSVSEVAGFDILPEDIIMNIVPEKDKLKVAFNTNMDFVTFKLRKEIEINGRIYETGKYISQDDLENIIANKYKKMNDVTDFLDNNLFIEKSFSKNQILGEEKEIKEEDEEEKSKKTFETEKRIIDIKKRIEAKIHPFYEKEITPIEKNDDDIHTYIIPDVHGALDEFIKDLKGIGLITIEENEFVWYRIDDSGFEVPIYEKPKDYEINKNNYIQIPRFTINKNFNGRVIQLGDLVDSHEGSTKSKECLAISILLSKQLREKYTTLVGNHEIAKLCGNKYRMDENNVAYEVPVIREAIKNGTIKLFHHTPRTNIINSHVPLFKDNILNFLNDTVLQHNDVYEYYSEKIDRLLEIIGAVKNNDGKYEIDDNKCLLDKKPPEKKDIEDFVDIQNKLYIITVEAGLEEDLLKTLVNDNRLYLDENGTMKLKGVSYEELSKHIFKGILNGVGHDATPTGLRGGKYSEKRQAEAHRLLQMLFTDEWQGKVCGSKFVEVRTNKKGESKVYFYKENMEKDKEKDDKKKNTIFELYSFDGKKIEKVEEKEEAEKKVEENNNLNENSEENEENFLEEMDGILYSLSVNIKTLGNNKQKSKINDLKKLEYAFEQNENQTSIDGIGIPG